MADPQTIGLAVSGILGMAAHEGFKTVIGETAKDAYKALKAKLAGWASEEVEAVEKHPDSAGRQQTLAEAIDSRPAPDQAAIKELATKLAAALKDTPPEGPVGAILRRIETLNLILSDITVTEGTGVIIEDTKATKDISLTNLKVGPGAGKDKQ